MNLYLYSDSDYSDGNAVGVVASNREEADDFVKKKIRGFSIEHCTCEVKEIGKGLLFFAGSYYRPWLSFEVEDE